MERSILFHGTSVERYQKHTDNFSLPVNWTTGPIYAFMCAYMFSYPLSGRIGDTANTMKILAYKNWDPGEFDKTVYPLVQESNIFPKDDPKAMWGIRKNDFPNGNGNYPSITVYDIWDLEEYVKAYIRNGARPDLLRLVNSQLEMFVATENKPQMGKPAIT